jgi:hypothetical protein
MNTATQSASSHNMNYGHALQLARRLVSEEAMSHCRGLSRDALEAAAAKRAAQIIQAYR